MPTVFSDNFTDTGGTTLASHVPGTGTSWTALTGTGLSGNMQIDTGGTYARNGTSGITAYTADATYPQADYTVTGTIVRPGSPFGDTFAVMGRAADGNNFYGFRNNATTWQIWTRIAGANTAVGTTFSAAPANGDIFTLEMIGSTLNGYVNSVLRCTATNSSLTAAGKGGLWWNAVNDQTGVGIDNFSVAYTAAGGSSGAGGMLLTGVG